MDKPTTMIYDWELKVWKDRYNLSGIAEHHPVLGKNACVDYASELVTSSFTDDVLTYETRNTVYVCPLKYMSVKPYQNIIPEYLQELSRRDEHSDNILDRIISSAAKIALNPETNDPFVCRIKELQKVGQTELSQKREAEEAELISEAEKHEDCIYLSVSKIDCGDLLSYHLGDKTGIIEPSLHLGMFQDSILYLGWDQPEERMVPDLDFRYFPKENEMETYSWSPNIRYAVIKNETGASFYFNKETVPVGETRVFSRSEEERWDE